MHRKKAAEIQYGKLLEEKIITTLQCPVKLNRWILTKFYWRNKKKTVVL